jgi:hypothetical protein
MYGPQYSTVNNRTSPNPPATLEVQFLFCKTIRNWLQKICRLSPRLNLSIGGIPCQSEDTCDEWICSVRMYGFSRSRVEYVNN